MRGPTPCRELTCTGQIAWLEGKVNPKTGKPANVPVDWDSLNTDEKEQYERGEKFRFDKSAGHRSHYDTCTKPNRFSKGGTITRTKLEEACFFAKKAMASNPRYQK